MITKNIFYLTAYFLLFIAILAILITIVHLFPLEIFFVLGFTSFLLYLNEAWYIIK